MRIFAILVFLAALCGTVSGQSFETGTCTIITLHPTKGGLGQATGSVIGETDDTYQVITNRHAVSRHPAITHVAIFQHPTYRSYILKLKTYAVHKDLAILEFKKEKNKKHWVGKLNPNYQFKPLEKVVVASVTPADGMNLKYGYYGNVHNKSLKELKFIGTAAKGNSGGAIMNSKGEVVAILNQVSDAGYFLGVKAPLLAKRADNPTIKKDPVKPGPLEYLVPEVPRTNPPLQKGASRIPEKSAALPVEALHSLDIYSSLPASLLHDVVSGNLHR